MTLFLVVARYLTDDIPLRIFTSAEAAKRFARTEPRPCASAKRIFNPDADSNTLVAHYVVEFRDGCAGR